MNAATTTIRPACPSCKVQGMKWGKDSKGHQRFRCRDCGSTFANRPENPLGNHRLPMDRAILVLSLLTENMSIRGIERVTGHHRDTVTRLLRTVGDRCANLLERLVKDVEVSDVQADEIWGFVGMKQKTKSRKKIADPRVGDSWCWTAIDRDSKLILAHHLGQRRALHADAFMEKVANATAGDFQLSTDGLESYPNAVDYNLGSRASYGQIVKQYGSTTKEDQRRYSPASIIAIEKRVISGEVDEDKICTSHVERCNLTIRTHMRRLTRLTCAFSKKWENLRAAYALHFATYNFVKFHRSLRMTPAMKAGVASKPWKMVDLVTA
ncbi:MAG: IS1 family transposase [Deltaproteobacteria bacterium]|nr:IS1 family transposase [Deltaproteobacteria bacterium]